jgi:hypothetical protein
MRVLRRLPPMLVGTRPPGRVTLFWR